MGRMETVTNVISGNMFQTASRKKPICLARVDAPTQGAEKTRATNTLRDMILGQKVRVEPKARDREGNTHANVYLGRQSVNHQMMEKTKTMAHKRSQPGSQRSSSRSATSSRVGSRGKSQSRTRSSSTKSSKSGMHRQAGQRTSRKATARRRSR